MIKSLIITAFFAAAPATAAEAPKPDLTAAFGNTIVSTYPDNRKGRLWLKPDGTYTGTGRRNTPSSGAWELKGSDLCLKQRKPVFVPITYCTPAPKAGVGSSWDAKAVTGEPIRVTIVKGIVR